MPEHDNRRPGTDPAPRDLDPLENNSPKEADLPLTIPPSAGVKEADADVPQREGNVTREKKKASSKKDKDEVEVTQEVVLLEDLSKDELKDLAKEKDLPVSGTKDELIERLS